MTMIHPRHGQAEEIKFVSGIKDLFMQQLTSNNPFCPNKEYQSDTI